MNTNPFVGPQPLSGDHPVFGRQRELRELQYLLTSERIVVLYSASGAGKSSLISGKGGLCDRLKKSFDVWPVTRVSTEAPFAVSNRWAWSAINGFERGEADESSGGWRLREYAEKRRQDGRHPLLVFDQFEEILRLDPGDTGHQKYEFFTEVGELLDDSRFWALFVLREDFLAQCDSYVRMLPTHMQNHYRLSVLDKANARTAIQKTADSGGRKFTDAALDRLVNDLAAGTDLVEPVQLQVVCHNLCEKVPAGAPPIEVAVIEELGDVTKALRLFYEKNITDIAKRTGVSERRIRDWCEHELIINETIRGQVLYDKNAPDALPESVVLGLEGFLIRKDNLRGVVDRYELSHDRLIRPIQRSNAEWWNKQAPLLRTAKGWEANNYSSSYLYTGEQLAEVLEDTDRADLDPLAERFLKACEVAEEDKRKEERSSQELKRWVAAMGVLVGLVIGPTVSTMGKLRHLLTDEQWFEYLAEITVLALAGAGWARAMFHWLQFRSDRAAVLRKITRKFRLDPSLNQSASHSAPAVRIPVPPAEAPKLSLDSLDPERLRTLRFAALWVFLLTGSQDGVFQTSELRALRQALRKAGRANHRASLVFRTVFRTVSQAESRWLAEFLADERSTRDGLAEVASVLAALDQEAADLVRQQLLDIARAILRCGRPRFSSQDEDSEHLLSSLQSILTGSEVALVGKPTKYYRHSKVFTDIDVLFAIAKSSLPGGLLAAGHAVVQGFIPLILPSLPSLFWLLLLFVKFWVIVLFARMIGGVTAHFLKEVRNEAADLFVRAVVATVAACVAGVATLVLSDSAPLDEILVNLLGLPILGAMIVRHGRSRVKGAFCEACGVWCEEEDLGVVEPVPLPQIRTALESGDLGALTALLAYDIESQDWEKRIASSDASGYVVDWLRITLHHCSECEKFTALSVTEVRLARTFWSKRAKTTLLGQPKGTDVNRIDRLLITPEKAALLRSHFCSEPEATASTE